jgi:nicotinate-nucleotide adenylyltransferase
MDSGARTMRRRSIGLLGGSFNPAHEGHLHISRTALQRLGLDEIWWLVSPQNPLKPAENMAPFGDRLATARAVVQHPRIRVSDIEQRLGTRYTVDTVRALARRYPDCGFVWLIGADNFIQFPAWRAWEAIMRTVPIAVFARPAYSFRALAGRAASCYARYRLREEASGSITRRKPPRWVFLHIKLHPASATAIRAGLAKGGRKKRSRKRRSRKRSRVQQH